MADDASTLITGWSGAAQQAYYNAKLQGDTDYQAFQKAQGAMQQAMSMAGAFGFAPGGNWADINSLAANAPPMGTPTLQAGGMTGSIGYIPGYTGVNAGQTSAELSGLAQTAQGSAGMTGFYAAPRQSQYTPGTFLKIDPNTYDYQTHGDQIDYVLPSGQIQRVSLPQARAMGWNGDLGALNTIPFSLAATLESAPPTQLPVQTLQSLSQYANLNAQAQNAALQQAGVTGMYNAPAQIYAPGTNMGGGKFQDLPADTQMAYYYSRGGDWTAAMNGWVADSNAAIQSFNQEHGLPNPNQPGTPQETLAAQQQYWQQAQQLAQMYGTYYAPNAPGGAVQPGVNAPQQGQQTLGAQQQYWQQGFQEQQLQQQTAQNYLQLMSSLRGPADWAQYQKVLGATPGGMKDLVAAAAGQYVPGAGGTSGTQPQSVTLPGFINQSTGQPGGGTQADQAAMNSLVAPNQMAPQTWNALNPSQKQLLLGQWEAQGYTQQDAQNLFNQSLPKYGTSTPQVGAFRLQ